MEKLHFILILLSTVGIYRISLDVVEEICYTEDAVLFEGVVRSKRDRER